jgi:hypothetical protein
MDTPSQALRGVATIEPSETHLRGGWLTLARVSSALIVAFALTVFVASLPVAFVQMHIACAEVCLSGQVTAAQAYSLHQLGITLDAFAAFELAFTILTSLVWFGVAAVVFWRRSDNLVPLLVAVQLVTQGASNGANALTGSATTWQTPAALEVTLNGILLFVFLAIFPNGRFAPRWIAWILIPGCLATAAELLPGVPQALQLVFPVMMFMLLGAQIYRYRAVSTSIQRQQTKWAILGIAASLVAEVGLLIPLALVPRLSAQESLYPLLAGTITAVTLTLGPIGFMFGVLRYRLYDIDVIINRTLVYSSLTALLAGVYFPLVIWTQTIAQAVTGRANLPAVAIVASTLLIVVLFNPLRHRIQVTIDRRFYRTKYDAQKTLATFGATLRSETDLPRLTEHLIGVVTETMQPAHISLWLSATERKPARPEIPEGSM